VCALCTYIHTYMYTHTYIHTHMFIITPLYELIITVLVIITETYTYKVLCPTRNKLSNSAWIYIAHTVFNGMRYINPRFTYLLTYLLTKVAPVTFSGRGPSGLFSLCWGPLPVGAPVTRQQQPTHRYATAVQGSIDRVSIQTTKTGVRGLLPCHSVVVCWSQFGTSQSPLGSFDVADKSAPDRPRRQYSERRASS